MGCDEFGEDGSEAVLFGLRVGVLKQSALGHEHRVTDQSSRPQRKCGSQPGFESNSTFQFGSKDVNYPVTIERRNYIRANLRGKTLG